MYADVNDNFISGILCQLTVENDGDTTFKGSLLKYTQ